MLIFVTARPATVQPVFPPSPLVSVHVAFESFLTLRKRRLLELIIISNKFSKSEQSARAAFASVHVNDNYSQLTVKQVQILFS